MAHPQKIFWRQFKQGTIVLGKCRTHEQSHKGRLKVPGYFQPSLTGLDHVSRSTQDFVLGYTQPSLQGLIEKFSVRTQTLKPGSRSRLDGPTKAVP